MLLIVLFILIFSTVSYLRPLPAIKPSGTISPPPVSQVVELPWPSYGQGAIAAQGYGTLQSHGEAKPVPIASVAKVITALAVLKQKPLSGGQSGPTITIAAEDVAIYNDYYTKGGSVVKVEAGEQLSERQALEALLIPSANNMADTLSRWAFGSQASYLDYANKMVKDMGLTNTAVADASGFSPKTLSTANDLALLGLAALDNSTIKEVVAKQSAELPVAGSVSSTNWLLDSDGVIGIKTGNTNEAGGCFLFAAKRTIQGLEVTLAGALTSAPDLNTAIKDARVIINASDNGFQKVSIITKQQPAADYAAPWGVHSQAFASSDVNVLNWRGQPVEVNVAADEVQAPAKAGAAVGKIQIKAGQKTTNAPLVLRSDLPKPPFWWRIFH